MSNRREHRKLCLYSNKCYEKKKYFLKKLIVLCGLESIENFSDKLPPDLRATEYTQVDTSRWTETETWVDWRKRPHVLKKLSKAYSSLSVEDWENLLGTTNPVESISHRSIPEIRN